jgi:hypothetical protein
MVPAQREMQRDKRVSITPQAPWNLEGRVVGPRRFGSWNISVASTNKLVLRCCGQQGVGWGGGVRAREAERAASGHTTSP